MPRQIPLKTVKADFSADTADQPDDQGRFTVKWASLIRVVLTSPRAAGATLELMRKSLFVLDEVDKAEKGCLGFLKLDEAMWLHLKGQVESQVWVSPKKELMEFSDDVINAEKVEMNAPAAAPAPEKSPAEKRRGVK